MKTPKRKQETCSRCGGELKVLDTKGSFCHLCGIFVNLGDGLRERHARWKRKNREARLRNMIKTITQKRNNALMAVVKLMQLKNETLGGMYGQDVEGS